ncbi:hypothetical protein CQA70_29805, partial [Klebsiella pneumoniae]
AADGPAAIEDQRIVIAARTSRRNADRLPDKRPGCVVCSAADGPAAIEDQRIVIAARTSRRNADRLPDKRP